MKVLITGSNGFVGSRLMFYLEQKGHTVVGIDKSRNCIRGAHSQTQLGDITNIQDLKEISTSFDWIIHAAAEKHDFGVSDEQYFQTNSKGTESIVSFAKRQNIKQILYYSTVSVYGHLDEPCGEDGPIEFNTIYGESKYRGEEILRKWQSEDDNNQLIILRPSIIYGPFNYANMYNLINGLYKLPIMIGDGNHIKSMVSLENLVDMTWFAIQNIKAQSILIYNCLDKPYLTVKKVIEIIIKNHGFKKTVLYLPYFLFWLPAKFIDAASFLLNKDLPLNSNRLKKFNTSTYYYSEKIRLDGYIQNYTIEEEIKKTIQWFLSVKKKS